MQYSLKKIGVLIISIYLLLNLSRISHTIWDTAAVDEIFANRAANGFRLLIICWAEVVWFVCAIAADTIPELFCCDKNCADERRATFRAVDVTVLLSKKSQLN